MRKGVSSEGCAGAECGGRGKGFGYVTPEMCGVVWRVCEGGMRKVWGQRLEECAGGEHGGNDEK